MAVGWPSRVGWQLSASQVGVDRRLLTGKLGLGWQLAADQVGVGLPVVSQPSWGGPASVTWKNSGMASGLGLGNSGWASGCTLAKLRLACGCQLAKSE